MATSSPPKKTVYGDYAYNLFTGAGVLTEGLINLRVGTPTVKILQACANLMEKAAVTRLVNMHDSLKILCYLCSGCETVAKKLLMRLCYQTGNMDDSFKILCYCVLVVKLLQKNYCCDMCPSMTK